MDRDDRPHLTEGLGVGTHGDLLLHLLLEAPPHVALLHQVVFVATGVLHSLLDHHIIGSCAHARWFRCSVSRGYCLYLDGAVGDDPTNSSCSSSGRSGKQGGRWFGDGGGRV